MKCLAGDAAIPHFSAALVSLVQQRDIVFRRCDTSDDAGRLFENGKKQFNLNV
jgi:hypothetical protein